MVGLSTPKTQSFTDHPYIVQPQNTTPPERKTPLYPGTRLFTLYSFTVYPNIDTYKVMLTMERFFEEYKNDSPEDYPTTTFIELIDPFL